MNQLKKIKYVKRYFPLLLKEKLVCGENHRNFQCLVFQQGTGQYPGEKRANVCTPMTQVFGRPSFLRQQFGLYPQILSGFSPENTTELQWI